MSYEKAPVGAAMLVREDKSLYEDLNEEKVLYLTVRKGDEGNITNHTWNEVNSHAKSWYEENNEKPYECEALVQFGNEEGPTSNCFGFRDVNTNATVRVSGDKASKRQQKSYRIKINQGSGNLNGMKSFVLSKSFGDPLRFSNKLCLDLISEISEMMSVRTNFVHLYVKDETENEDELFVDYGLYTMVEPINKRYLKSRELDKFGELYEAKNFDFGRHEDVIKQPTDAEFNKESFEELLEAEGSDDYSKLIAVLDAVNDNSLSIEDIVDTYFDKDNLYSWLAFNILVDNKSTDVENFGLYCPTGISKFYIIPWDFDGAFRKDYELIKDSDYNPGWEKGIYLYTESQLFSRIMKSEYCTNELSEYVTKLHDSVLSAEHVSKKANELSEIVEPRLYSLPDMAFARVTESNYKSILENLGNQVDQNFYAYYDSLATPWPFHINEPVVNEGNVTITWDESYMINQGVTYSVELSDSWEFDNVISSGSDIAGTSFDVGALPKGQYFVRVTAHSQAGVTQEAYEFYSTEKKTTVHGVLCFYVLDDGTVVKS